MRRSSSFSHNPHNLRHGVSHGYEGSNGRRASHEHGTSNGHVASNGKGASLL